MPIEDLMPEVSRFVWNEKYRLKRRDESGTETIIDQTVEDTWRRVAGALAEAEKPDERARWSAAFYDAMDGFKFVPAGRIVAGAGSGRDVTLMNCYTMGAIEDDLGSIYAHLREAALTMQQGGGIGYDFSTLRYKGALVRGVDSDASGPLSFMDCWDVMCRTIMSAGYRRGAMMATLRVDHPDIEDFISVKGDKTRLRMFNLSVLVTDAFMAAVDKDGPWDLVWNGAVIRTLPARDLWDQIMRSTYAYAEPGVLFIDRINRRNNLYYCEEIRTSNPCGEEVMGPYANCLLGALNLAIFVKNPFTADAHLDLPALRSVIITAVRMLDNANDISNFPLPQQKEQSQLKRRIGLGIMGLADALAMCGLRYGSLQAVQQISHIIGLIEDQAYLASTNLAEEKGCFPFFDRDLYLAGEHVSQMSMVVRQAIAERGIRNSHLMAIAPTGTISQFAMNVAGGIEPFFSLKYSRKFLMPDGSRQEKVVEPYAVALWRQLRGAAPLPDYFVDTSVLSPEDHLEMLAAGQEHVDASISKTINVPEDIPFEAFKGVYWTAYRTGCKSCTTFRPNAITGSVLEPVKDAPASTAIESPIVVDDLGVVRLTPPLPSPDEVEGKRYRIRWPDTDHALYVILTDIEEHGRKRPWEMFLVSNEAESDEWRIALGRMISAVFKKGGDVAFVAGELKAIFDKKGGAWLNGPFATADGRSTRHGSLPAAIGAVLEKHWRWTGFLATEEPTISVEEKVAAAEFFSATGTTAPLIAAAPHYVRSRQCPKCGEPSLIRVENCDQCPSCGYNKCG